MGTRHRRQYVAFTGMLLKPIHISETEESGMSCVGVKFVDLRSNANSEGSSLVVCFGGKVKH